MSSKYDSEADQTIEDAKQLNKLLEKAGASVRAKIEPIEPDVSSEPQSPSA